MDASFWHQKWENDETAFHEGWPNTLLVKHFTALGLPKGSRIFVPLCGKSEDMVWLLSQGYRVVGAELSEMAIQQFFEGVNLEPEVTDLGDLKLYQGPDIDIYVGDIFKLSANQLGSVEGIYDRAALVALPPEMRISYTKHLTAITGTAPQLIIVFDYDQSILAGPPFSIPATEIRQHYQDRYSVEQLDRLQLEGGLKGQVAATENAWLLKP